MGYSPCRKVGAFCFGNLEDCNNDIYLNYLKTSNL